MSDERLHLHCRYKGILSLDRPNGIRVLRSFTLDTKTVRCTVEDLQVSRIASVT